MIIEGNLADQMIDLSGAFRSALHDTPFDVALRKSSIVPKSKDVKACPNLSIDRLQITPTDRAEDAAM